MADARNLRPISMSRAQIRAFASDLQYPLKPYQVDLVHETVNLSEDSIFYDGARQVFGKTQVQVICMLIFAINGRVVIYSAHKKDTVRAIMNRLVHLSRKLQGTGVVSREALSNGFEELFFTSGGAIHFRTRVDGVGVGLSVDVIVWDEAQMVSRRAISDAEPALDASDYPVSIHIGTPPKADEYRLYPDSPFVVAYLNGDPRFIHHGPVLEYDRDLEYTWEDHGRYVTSWRHASSMRSRLQKAWEGAVTENQREDFWRDKLSVWKRPEKWVTHEPSIPMPLLKKLFTSASSRAQSFYGGVGILPNSTKAYVTANDGRQLMVAQEVDLGAGDLEPLADWLRANSRRFKLLRIPGNARGQALIQLLVDKGVAKAKIRQVGLPELSSSLARFFRMVESGEWQVYERDYVRLALGSFWLEFDQRSGSSFPKAAAPEDEALVLGLFMASVDKNLTDRARQLNGTGTSDDQTQPDDTAADGATTPREVFSEPEARSPRARAKVMVW